MASTAAEEEESATEEEESAAEEYESAAEEDESAAESVTSRASQDIKTAAAASRINNQNDASPSPSMSSKDFIVSTAASIASQPLQNYDSNVWGVLTAISSNARKRRQGINIVLTSDEHCLGRLPCHAGFQIESNAIDGNHCKIYRRQKTDCGEANKSSCDVSVFVEDTSTNGTFLNWERLRKNGPEVRVLHGDIISLPVPPEHDKSFAFVYREVLGNNPALSSMDRKRKAGLPSSTSTTATSSSTIMQTSLVGASSSGTSTTVGANENSMTLEIKPNSLQRNRLQANLGFMRTHGIIRPRDRVTIFDQSGRNEWVVSLLHERSKNRYTLGGGMKDILQFYDLAIGDKITFEATMKENVSHLRVIRVTRQETKEQDPATEARALVTRLTEEKNSAVQLNNRLQQELDQLKRDSKRSQSGGGIPFMYVLLVGLIGLILGYIMKRT